MRDGGVIAYPTDSSYALGCRLGDADAAQRIRADPRRRRRPSPDAGAGATWPTLGTFARLDNWQFRIVRQGIPGPYTFILPATREVPRRLQHPQAAARSACACRTIRWCSALLAELGEPILSSTLMLPGDDRPLNDADGDPRASARRSSIAIIDAGACPAEPTTVVDLASDPPTIMRLGRGDPARLGLATR